MSENLVKLQLHQAKRLISFTILIVQIIPSINVPTFEEVKARIARVEPYVSWCHLDVTDGVFSTHPTWHDPADLALLNTRLKVEVHLMIDEPERIVDQWLAVPVKRVIVHIEATKNLPIIIEKCHAAGVEIGVALNPETSWEQVKDWYEKTDLIQILGVRPGPSGQPMQEEIFGKIAHVRKFCSQCIIEVDGGVNVQTAKRAVDAGANLLVMGSAIFSAPDIGKAIEELNRHIHD